MDDGADLAYSPAPNRIVSAGWDLGRWGLGESEGAVQPERSVCVVPGTSTARELQTTKRKRKGSMKAENKQEDERR